MTYDLYGVSNHHSLHNAGGHYTNYVLHSDERGENWYECNDRGVSRIEKNEIISRQAFILFYKRREFLASSIVNLNPDFN